MSWTLDDKIRIHARLPNTSYMGEHYWTSVSLRRLYIGQFPSLHFKDQGEGFFRSRSKDVSHDNKKYWCTMELPNKSASFVVIFVLFWSHLGRICDICFSQKCWKSFNSRDKNKLFSYDIIRGIQQATSISFFPFVGIQSGNRKRTYFALLGSRSEHGFSARSWVPPKRINSRKTG